MEIPCLSLKSQTRVVFGIILNQLLLAKPASAACGAASDQLVAWTVVPPVDFSVRCPVSSDIWIMGPLMGGPNVVRQF